MKIGPVLLTFISTHETLRAERAIKNGKIRVRTTIKPRAIVSDCTMALMFAHASLEEVRIIVENESLDVRNYFCQADDKTWVPLDED